MFIITMLISTSLILIKLFVCDYRLNFFGFLFSLLVFLIFFISFKNSNSSYILSLILILFGAKNIGLNQVVKIHFFVYFSIMIISLFLSLLGVIENYTVYNASQGIRYSLGNTYPTDFSAGIFYLILDIIFLKKQKWKLFDSFLVVILSFVVYIYTRALMSFTLCIIVNLLLIIINSRKKFFRIISKKISQLLIIIYPLLALISICATIFSTRVNFLENVNEILDNRLSYGLLAIEKYGFSLLGRNIQFLGNGWGTEATQSSYFYVDNGYLYTGLVYGLVILIFFSLMLSIVGFRIRKKTSVLTLILFIVAFSALGEPRFINFLYNPFLFSISYYVFFKNIDCD